jgi:KUP system potassium uptake protein
MVIRYGYAEQVLSKELGKTVYTELRNYVITELLPDGRSSAIVNPHEGRVTNTMARRLEEKEPKPLAVKDLKLSENATETGSSSASKTLPAATDSIDSKPKAPIVDINERDSRLQAIDDAYKQQVLYVVGKTELKIPEKGFNIIRRFFLGAFLYLRDLTNEKSTSLRIPMDKLVEVGFIREL